MNPFEMVVLIILIVTAGRVLSARRSRAQGQAGVDPAEAAMLRDEVRQLKDRIQVLERVITDNHGSIDLDRQIERLRDR